MTDKYYDGVTTTYYDEIIFKMFIGEINAMSPIYTYVPEGMIREINNKWIADFVSTHSSLVNWPSLALLEKGSLVQNIPQIHYEINLVYEDIDKKAKSYTDMYNIFLNRKTQASKPSAQEIQEALKQRQHGLENTSSSNNNTKSIKKNKKTTPKNEEEVDTFDMTDIIVSHTKLYEDVLIVMYYFNTGVHITDLCDAVLEYRKRRAIFYNIKHTDEILYDGPRDEFNRKLRKLLTSIRRTKRYDILSLMPEFGKVQYYILRNFIYPENFINIFSALIKHLRFKYKLDKLEYYKNDKKSNSELLKNTNLDQYKSNDNPLNEATKTRSINIIDLKLAYDSLCLDYVSRFFSAWQLHFTAYYKLAKTNVDNFLSLNIKNFIAALKNEYDISLQDVLIEVINIPIYVPWWIKLIKSSQNGRIWFNVLGDIPRHTKTIPENISENFYVGFFNFSSTKIEKFLLDWSIYKNDLIIIPNSLIPLSINSTFKEISDEDSSKKHNYNNHLIQHINFNANSFIHFDRTLADLPEETKEEIDKASYAFKHDKDNLTSDFVLDQRMKKRFEQEQQQYRFNTNPNAIPTSSTTTLSSTQYTPTSTQPIYSYMTAQTQQQNGFQNSYNNQNYSYTNFVQSIPIQSQQPTSSITPNTLYPMRLDAFPPSPLEPDVSELYAATYFPNNMSQNFRNDLLFNTDAVSSLPYNSIQSQYQYQPQSQSQSQSQSQYQQTYPNNFTPLNLNQMTQQQYPQQGTFLRPNRPFPYTQLEKLDVKFVK